MSAENFIAGIIGSIALTSPLWLFCIAWCVIFRSQIKEKMRKGLSFKGSVKQVFKENLLKGSYQCNNAFDFQKQVRRMANSSHNAHNVNIPQPASSSSWVTDPDYKHLSGNIYNKY